MTADELREALERWRLGKQPKQRIFRINPLWGAEVQQSGVVDYRQRPDGVWEMAE